MGRRAAFEQDEADGILTRQTGTIDRPFALSRPATRLGGALLMMASLAALPASADPAPRPPAKIGRAHV